jgi:hypothetical protein
VSAEVVQLRLHRGRTEEARRDRIVREAEALIRVYEQRAKTYQHISLKELRRLRDAVRGEQP